MLKGLKFKNIFFILLGAAIFSFGLVHFNMQNNLAEGGFTGITLLLYFVFGWSPSITNLLLNLPLFFIGWKAAWTECIHLYHHRNCRCFHISGYIPEISDSDAPI